MSANDTRFLSSVRERFYEVDTKYDCYRAKIFSCLGCLSGDLFNFTNSIPCSSDWFPNARPALFAILSVQDNAIMQTIMTPTLAEQRLCVYERVVSLPSGQYSMIASPFNSVEGKHGTEESIAFLQAFLSAFMGKMYFYTKAAEFDFFDESKISFSGRIFRLPMYADNMGILDSKLANKLIVRLGVQQPPFRATLQRACSFLSQALDQDDESFRFASYWVALEVLAGKTQAIRAQLAAAYGKTPQYVDNNLLFSELSFMRHQLLHNGQFSILRSYQERLLQLYFWDIIIFKLGLPSRGLSRLLVESEFVKMEKQGHPE